MKNRNWPLMVAVASLLAIHAQAADVLRLKHGDYVLANVACQDAPFAALMSYDGKGFGDPHSHDCHSRISGRDGSAMKMETSCINAGEGPAPRVTSTETVKLRSFTAFDVISKGQTASYRWCASTMPAPEKKH